MKVPKVPQPAVRIVIDLPLRDFTAFAEATEHLARKMGRRAPDVFALVVHQLRRRDVPGLTEEYLESAGWPVEGTKPIRPRKPRKAPPAPTVPELADPPAAALGRN
jgi:hypothetical protein